MGDLILTRRAALAGAALLTPGIAAGAGRAPGRALIADPFTLGVASGSPSPDGFVLWTRLAPDPLAPDGSGGLAGAAPVDWEIAEDEGMRRIVRRGRTLADARWAHSVHLEMSGLQPDRPYWYRFAALGHRSPVGRARTTPAPGAPLSRLRFAVASCAHWELGWFSAYRHMAAEDPDLVMFLGDYIYEYSLTGDRAAQAVRRHDQPAELVTLAQYRNRYALHRTDPDLRALHAAAPCLVTWDDHEVQNDYANGWSQDVDIPPSVFLQRRAAAYRAFYEHMPLRASARPRGPDMRIYGRTGFGDLADISVLDGRQYRTIQPCPNPRSRRGHVASCPDLADPSRTMLGLDQERWLYDGFRKPRARWTLVAQDLLVAPVAQTDAAGAPGHFTDGWDGYQANRGRMLSALAETRAPNPVFLGGDMHCFWATDLKADFDKPAAPAIASEFIAAAISQTPTPAARFGDVAANNPHIRYAEFTTNGYLSIDLTPQRLAARMQAVSDRRDPHATVSTLKRFVVEDGRPGVQPD